MHYAERTVSPNAFLHHSSLVNLMKNLLMVNLVLLSLVGCVASQADTVPSNSMGEQAPITTNGVQKIHIEGGSYFFKPNHFTVKVNIPVELMIKVESGLVPHNFVIKSPETGVMVEESLSSNIKTIRFTPKAIGKITFYCSHGLPFAKSHRERGMEGVIDVVK